MIVARHDVLTLPENGPFMLEKTPNATDITTLSTISGALSSVVDEMSSVVIRTARSAVFKLAKDFSCSLCDWDGRQLVQGDAELPVQVGSIPLVCRAVAKAFEGRVYAEDVFLCNDPVCGGTHLNDVALLRPIFEGDELFCWTVIRAHWLDIGGVAMADLRRAQTDVYGEGLRLAPIKIIEKGRNRQDILDLLFDNFRFQKQQRSDMLSMMAACTVAEKRMRALLSRYGLETFKSCVEELYDRNEQKARKAIMQLQDGVYHGSAFMSAREGDHNYEIKTELKVFGDQLKISLSAPPQLRDVRNSPFGATQAAVYHSAAISLRLKPPFNDGIFRTIEIDYGPLGTIVNAQVPPAAVLGCTSQPFNEIIDSVRMAFTEVIADENKTAGWCAASPTTLSGVDPDTDTFYAHYHPNAAAGGSGATWGGDGWSAVGSEGTGGAVQRESIELVEHELPIRFHSMEYRTDSAGAGHWRGGLGMDCSWEAIDHEQTSRFHGTIEHLPPVSVAGAKSTLMAPKIGQRFAIDADGTRRAANGASRLHAQKNGSFEMRPPGGGGVGDPFGRPLDKVVEDVRNGYVSVGGARLDYGCVIDPNTFEPDIQATRELRRK